MITFCPACGINVPTNLETAAGKRVWKCATCRLVLKQEPTAPAPVAYEARAAAAGGAGQSAIAGAASFGLEGDPGEFVFDPFEAPQSRAVPSPAPVQRVQPRAQPMASPRPAMAQQAGFAPARPQPAASLAAQHSLAAGPPQPTASAFAPPARPQPAPAAFSQAGFAPARPAASLGMQVANSYQQPRPAPAQARQPAPNPIQQPRAPAARGSPMEHLADPGEFDFQRAAPGPAPHGGPVRAGEAKPAQPAAIDLDEGDPGEFVLEAMGGERVINSGPASGMAPAPTARPQPQTQAPPQPQAFGFAPAPKAAAKEENAARDAIELDENDPGEFVIEAMGGERTISAGAANGAGNGAGGFAQGDAVGGFAAAPSASPAAGSDPGISLDEDDPGEFVLEAMGGERTIKTSPVSPRPAQVQTAPAQPVRQPNFDTRAAAAMPQQPVRQATPPAASIQAPQRAPGGSALFEKVVITEGNTLVREVIKDALLQNRLCGEVLGCANGEQLLQTMAGSLGRRPAVSLVILDVEMPILNGYQAAIALRAFERGFGLPPTPIVFFSSLALNETFTKVIEYVHPARYLAKGTDSAAQMALRLAQALGTLTSS